MEFEPIAIVGRSCLFPGASTPEQLWDLVAAGRSAISSRPENRGRASRLADSGVRAVTDRGGFVPDLADAFDPRGFTIDPGELLRYDELVRWVLQTAGAALRDAAVGIPPPNTGAVFGLLCVPTQKFAAFAESVVFGEPGDPLGRFNSGFTAHVLAQALKLDRGAFALDAACASSLYAIQLACQELHSGRADMMLAGAVSRADDLFLRVGFSTLQAISPTGSSRPFHRGADGLLPAEGASFVVLKRLPDAIRAGDTIHGLLRGIGVSNDGHGGSPMSPSQRGQEEALRAAYRIAAMDPAEISLLECHATGTPVGDACELRSSGQVFAGKVSIGSVKSNLGHAMTAAGMAGLVKLLEAMRAKVRPGTLHLSAPADRIALLDSSPFRVVTANEPWDATSPRKAALSAFGFGGNNAHLIVEEWAGQYSAAIRLPAPAPRAPVAIVSIGVLAGDCANLDQFTQRLFGKNPGPRRTDAIELDLDGLGFPPADLERIQGQQTMALAAATEALAKIGEIPAARTGVYAGLGCDPEGAKLGMDAREWSPAAVIGGLANIVANRISNRFNFCGPSLAVMAEESSGLIALRQAARALQTRHIDLAIAGAVDLSCESVHEVAARTLLDSEKHQPGDAAVFFALKRLEDAERAGDRVYATFDPDDAAPAEPSTRITHRFGHAHAASGMLEAAAAVLQCAHSVRLPGRPWLEPADQRRIRVRVEALGGGSSEVVFGAHTLTPPLPLILDLAARAYVFPGEDGSRMAIVASSENDLNRKRTRALEMLQSGGPMQMLAPDGIYYRKAPLAGELAFVFPGAAASYHGPSCSLLTAFPDAVQETIGRARDFAPGAAWMFDETPRPAAPHEKLAASTLLCQVHAHVTRDCLGLKPHAAIGFSGGETNSLLAFQVWKDADKFFSEFVAAGMLGVHLSGEFRAVNGVRWETWIILVPETRLREILDNSVRLLAKHAPGEYLIAGPAEACAHVVRRVGKGNAKRIDFDMVVHCPDLRPVAGAWRTLHCRETFVPEHGPRFYQLATGRAYPLSRDAIAEALTAQALDTLDFPRVIRQAWDDGVRVFLEHGPRGSCTSWIQKILEDREHVAIALDSPGADSLTQAMCAAAQLIVAGIDVDLTKFEARVSRRSAAPPARVLRLAAHPPPVELQIRPRAQAATSNGDSRLALHMKRIAAEHVLFQETSTRLHEQFLETSQRAFQHFMSGTAVAVAPAPIAIKPASQRTVVFTRDQIETTASGRISDVYGPEFQELDTFRRICRLPMPPMLLIDRVVKLEGEPRSMKLGAIHTETDVRPDSWFLHRDRIPAGLMIEGGQADMMLISWLGIDLQVRGDRVYRMLGCEVKFHDGLARTGETLRYEIKINGHARQGDARIFFFQYDCFVGERLALTVRNGQAGFFSDAELAGSAGVLWNAETARPKADGRGAKPLVAGVARRFDASQIAAAAAGSVFECFGKGFEFTGAHQRPPSFARPELLLFDRVTNLDFEGGSWKRGHCRAEYDIRPDSWLFTSHFKDDPCLPGTIMLEGSFQLMSFYMMSLGLTIHRDGWRFEPVREEMFELLCRGQVTPESKLLVCEMFVEEFIDGPEPMLFADVLGTVDGLKAFRGRRLGLRLVPGNPLDESRTKRPPEQKQVAQVNGVALNYDALLACAWGLPSAAFGEPYARFDLHERCPRLPGPPYHCMTRITRVDGEFGVESVGSTVEAEFDLDPDAWFFTANGTREMPFSLLLEAGLQPCGWLSCFTGIPLRSKAELYFRNLDGASKQLRRIPLRPGVLVTRAKLINVARQGTVTLVSFDVGMHLDGESVLEMKTGFGFFTKEDLAGQTGIPASPAELAARAQPCEFDVDLSSLPAKYFARPLRLATDKLLMIDRITGLWPDQARIRASREVRPGDWYFKAHFYQDPVQPGSLGLEALIQTLQFYAIECGVGSEFRTPRFESSEHSVWKYRGQVTPSNHRIETEVRVKNVDHILGKYVLNAEGWVWVDGVRIYHMPKFGLIVSESLE